MDALQACEIFPEHPSVVKGARCIPAFVCSKSDIAFRSDMGSIVKVPRAMWIPMNMTVASTRHIMSIVLRRGMLHEGHEKCACIGNTKYIITLRFFKLGMFGVQGNQGARLIESCGTLMSCSVRVS